MAETEKLCTFSQLHADTFVFYWVVEDLVAGFKGRKNGRKENREKARDGAKDKKKKKNIYFSINYFNCTLIRDLTHMLFLMFTLLVAVSERLKACC